MYYILTIFVLLNNQPVVKTFTHQYDSAINCHAAAAAYAKRRGFVSYAHECTATIRK